MCLGRPFVPAVTLALDLQDHPFILDMLQVCLPHSVRSFPAVYASSSGMRQQEATTS